MTEEATTTLSSADIIEIMKLLPHRYPFLMVDKIIQIDGDNSAIGIKNVTVNEPHFTGHFPEAPIMPGVLLIEGMAQTAGAICAKKEGQPGNLVYFMTIENAVSASLSFLETASNSMSPSTSSAAISGNSIATPRLTAPWSPKPISEQ